VYHGWCLTRKINSAPTREEKAVKVFRAEPGSKARENYNRELKNLQDAKEAAKHNCCMIGFMPGMECPPSGREQCVTYLLPLELCEKGPLVRNLDRTPISQIAPRSM